MGRKTIKIDTTLEARLSFHGGMFYISIQKRTVDFYGLGPGDLLKVKILEAIKEVSAAEREAPEAVE